VPDFDWSEEEQIEIQEALEATDAWQRYLDEGPETRGVSVGLGKAGSSKQRDLHKGNGAATSGPDC